MIVEVLLKGILLIIKPLFTLIKTLIPTIGIPINFISALGIILTTTSQANNFMYFIMRRHMLYIVPIIVNVSNI